MRPAVRRHRVVAVLCAGALVVAACGDDDAPAADPVAPVTTEAASDDPTDVTSPADTSAGTTDAAPPETPAPADEPAPTGTTDDPGAPDAPETTPAPDASPDVPEILQVSAPVVGGGELDLADYADRPLLLWFWAPF